jgi:hypothetical protein
MSLYQIRVYCTRADGIDGVEKMHELTTLEKPRSPKDPRWKILTELASKAAKNIISGKRWDYTGE